MSDSFTSELLREMENELKDVQYEMIPGLRQGSLVLWVSEENQIYYRNSSKRNDDIGYVNG